MTKQTVIESGMRLRRLDPREWWEHKHVLSYLIYRDSIGRYKQTVLGVVWVVAQPLIEAAIFTLIFRHVFHPDITLPYPVFVFSGVMIWSYASVTIQRATTSIVGHANLIKRLYFPKVLLPVSVACSRFIDLLITMVALLIIAYFYHVEIGLLWLWTIPLLILAAIAATAIGMWFSILHVYYRDTGLAVPYLLRIGLFVTPVFYPLQAMPERWHLLISLNPFTGILTSFREVLSGMAPFLNTSLALSISMTGILFISAIIVFHACESTLIDEL